jgi:2-hydroxychromene-2-carboxylate isomerase
VTAKTVEFMYDYVSASSYVAWTQIETLCARHGATVVRRPVFLGGIFKATGNSTPAAIKAKGAWLFADLKRHCDLYGVPFNMNPHFIFNPIQVMRGAHWALQTGTIEAYDRAMFRAAWVDGVNLADAAEAARVVEAAGLDVTAFQQAVQSPAIKQALIDETEACVERGAFGAPTFFVSGVLHFGQDRLSWVERAIAG